MSLNKGPQPKLLVNQNGVRYVDPNPTDQIVNHEDLVMYVKLIARTKGRSILTNEGNNISLELERKFTRSETNFTYNDDKNSLNTDWTNLGGGPQAPGTDIGTFGITNINIEFKSSFMPKIVIDFVDIRGATLFEQGPCSPYSAFLHLPYPVFELTVKGYYGKPVNYTLALIKFNTKFNSETGNFESKAEFVGYTYAFLADIPMGYVMATPYMKNFDGEGKLEKIWARYRKLPGMSDETFGLPKGKMKLYDLIKQAKLLESETPKLKNTTQVVDLAKVGKVKNSLIALRNDIESIQKKWIDKCSGKTKKCLVRYSLKNETKKNFPVIIVNSSSTASEKVMVSQIYNGGPGSSGGVVFPMLGDGTEDGFGSSHIGIRYASMLLEYQEAGITSTPPSINFETVKENVYGFWKQPVKQEGDDEVYGVDVWPCLLEPIQTSLVEIEKLFDSKRENLKELLNAKVKQILGFHPSIRNVFAVILANTEAFLEILKNASVEAEQHHIDNKDIILSRMSTGNNILGLKDSISGGNGPQESDEKIKKDNNVKIYPWPTYYQTIEAEPDAGEKEQYPGENSEFNDWPEVKFVEDFIIALTELKTDLNELNSEIEEGSPGFDNFVPLSVLDSPIFGDEEAACRWFNVGRGSEALPNVSDSQAVGGIESLFSTIGENAFIFGDYSFINSLSIWKSQRGFYNGFGFNYAENGVGNAYGYDDKNTSPNIDLVGPQRFMDNPHVNGSIAQNGVAPPPNLARFKTQESNFGSGGWKWNEIPWPRPNWGTKSSFDVNTMMVTKWNNVSPTTPLAMKRAGYVDALNALSTLYGQRDKELISFIKAQKDRNDNIESLRDFIKKKVKDNLKKRWGGNYKELDFDKFTEYATAKINNGASKPSVILKQEDLYTGPFEYVKKNKVLILEGPILKTNDDTLHPRTLPTSYISANPYNNPRNSVALMTDDEIKEAGGASIKEAAGGNITEKLVGEFKNKWPDNTNRASKENDGRGAGASTSSKTFEDTFFYNLRGYLSNKDTEGSLRPVWGTSEEKAGNQAGDNPSPYYSYGELTQINMPFGHVENGLPYFPPGGENQIYNLYYRHQDVSDKPSSTAFETGSWDKTGNQAHGVLWDLGSSRIIYTKDDSKVDFFDSVGTAAYYNLGAADALCQTPLWTLNYPEFKCPLMGMDQFLAREEINSVANHNAGVEIDSDGGGLGKWHGRWGNWPFNYSRNFATWWGINTWGTKTTWANGGPTRYIPTKNSDTFGGDYNNQAYKLPLCYLFLMSLGFAHPQHRGPYHGDFLGIYFPTDGIYNNCTTSLGNFISYGIYNLPRVYILTIGAVLWRMKEGRALMWDKDSEGNGIDPTLDFQGWNQANKSNFTQNVVGVDDLSDPVWFFHNCLSKPKFAGGTVTTTNGPGTNYAQYPMNGTTYNGNAKEQIQNDNYTRKYLGEIKSSLPQGGYDVWSNSGGNAADRHAHTKKGLVPFQISAVNWDDIVPNANAYQTGQYNSPWTTGNVGFLQLPYEQERPDEYTGWVKSSQNSDYKEAGNATGNSWILAIAKGEGLGIDDVFTPKNIMYGMFDQCRQDQLPYFDPYQIKVNQSYEVIGNGDDTGIDPYNYGASFSDWWEPNTLVISSTGSDRKQQFAIPVSGSNISPNRINNGYINIKELCKSLVFLPTELKRQFIKEFEDFSRAGTVKEAKKMGYEILKTGSDEKKEADTWLTTIDPLNFERNYGLGSKDYDLFDYMYAQPNGVFTKTNVASINYDTSTVITGTNDISAEVGHNSYGFPKPVRGFYGFVHKDHVESLRQFSDSDSFWFDKPINNPWYCTYGRASVRDQFYDG